MVDVPSREVVRADGTSTRLTLKSIAVLLVLAEHAGRVVTREALLDAVWAGTLPTIDVVTQAVVSLRKALGDGGATAFVETIPKTGYRLLLPVEWLPRAEGPPSPTRSPASARAPRSRRRVSSSVLAGGALLATLGWSMAGWQDSPLSRTDPPAPRSGGGDVPYTLLTSRPGFEVNPALSPDGASMAYSMSPEGQGRDYAIYVQSTEPTPPRQLTAPSPGFSDRLPRWSPDGLRIMFARVDAHGCELRLLPATGGMERVVGRCDRFSGGNYDWLPDGSGIVAGVSSEGGSKPSPLSILRLATGEWEPMSYPIEPGNVDYDPRFSSDGTRLGFRRNLVRAEIQVMPAQGGQPRPVTRLRSEINGWDWSPDDRSVLVSLGNGASRLVRYDLASHRSETLGHIPAGTLDVAPHGGRMVFTTGEARVAMFRYPLPLRAGAEAQPLFPSTGTDLLPSPSPDGRMIAFHSDRSRETRLWIGEPGARDRLRMIDGLMPLRMHPVQWSEDGSHLLLVADPAEPGNEPGPKLYEVDVASGRFQAVPLEGIPYVAQYMPGGRLLVLVDLGSGKWSLRILDRASPGRVLAQLDEVGEARFDAASGQVFFVHIDTPGLWSVAPDLAAPVRVDDTRPSTYWMTQWALLGGKAISLRAVPGCGAEWFWIGPASTSPAGCLDRDRKVVAGLALVPSRRGDWLYASMSLDDGNRDIGVLDRDAWDAPARATR